MVGIGRAKRKAYRLRGCIASARPNCGDYSIAGKNEGAQSLDNRRSIINVLTSGGNSACVLTMGALSGGRGVGW